MDQLPKQVLLICVLYALAGQAMADSLSDANRAYGAGNYEEAAKLYIPLALRGDAEAQTTLGVMYNSGRGVPQDSKEAAKWYRLAAEKGFAPAQAIFGDMYAKGRGVPQDYKEAVRWYRLAAEQGDVIGQINLGVMYGNGQGVPQDYVRAHMWINIATANADSEDQNGFIEKRNSVAKKMTANQIAEAQELARKCTAKKFKGC